MTKHILNVVTNVGHYDDPSHPTGLWLSELTHAWHVFAEAGYEVAFTTAKGMLERVKATFDEGGTEAAVARYAKCDVLVLDDLGKEDATEWSVGTVFSVLDARYEDMRPTIVTSNYAPGALADRLARRGERVTAEAIASRISQTCRPVYLGGRDRRRLG